MKSGQKGTMFGKARLRIGVIMLLMIVLAGAATTVLAGSTWFYVNVPKFGRCATTSITIKSTANQQWVFSNIRTGGDKVMRFRPLKNGSAIGYFHDGKTGSWVAGYYTQHQNPGARIYGQICNKWWQPVNVEVSGRFDSH